VAGNLNLRRRCGLRHGRPARSHYLFSIRYFGCRSLARRALHLKSTAVFIVFFADIALGLVLSNSTVLVNGVRKRTATSDFRYVWSARLHLKENALNSICGACNSYRLPTLAHHVFDPALHRY